MRQTENKHPGCRIHSAVLKKWVRRKGIPVDNLVSNGFRQSWIWSFVLPTKSKLRRSSLGTPSLYLESSYPYKKGWIYQLWHLIILSSLTYEITHKVNRSWHGLMLDHRRGGYFVTEKKTQNNKPTKNLIHMEKTLFPVAHYLAFPSAFLLHFLHNTVCM